MNAKTEDRLVNTIVTIIMCSVIVVSFYTLYYAAINALNDAGDIQKNGFIYLLPRVFTWDNLKLVFSDKELIHAFGVTVARTIIGTFTSVLFTAIVSYPLSCPNLVGRRIYMRIGTLTMYFNGGLIPTFLVFNSLHLIDSFWVYILPMMFSFFNAIIFINFFRTIPYSLIEAARIDGANDWTIFWKIVFPLSKPVVATIALFNGVNQWNSWFDTAYYTFDKNLKTLQQVLYGIISQTEGAAMAAAKLGASSMNLNTIDAIKYATMLISIIPIAVIYPFLQKHFVSGMMVGSVKE